MSRWRSIWLVARREILERGRSRGFIFSVLFTTAIVVGSFALTAFLRGGDAQVKVGVVAARARRPRDHARGARRAGSTRPSS